MLHRSAVDVDGERLSYLHAGESGQPVLGRIGDTCRAVALDLPGFGPVQR